MGPGPSRAHDCAAPRDQPPRAPITYLQAARTAPGTWVMFALAPLSGIAVAALELAPGNDGLWVRSTVLVVTTAFLLASVGAAASRRKLVLGRKGLLCASGPGSRRYAEWVPLALIDGFEVRRWTRPPGVPRWSEAPASPTVYLSVRLQDGRRLQTSWCRAEGSGVRRAPLLLVRRHSLRFASTVPGETGTPLRWDERSDRDLVQALDRDLQNLKALAPPSGPTKRGTPGKDWTPAFLISDVQWRAPRSIEAERQWRSERLDAPDAPVPPPAAPPIPPRPRLDPGDSTPSDHPELPAVFWSLASERSGALLGRRSSLRISPGAIVFNRRWRRDLHLPVSAVDRFDLEFEVLREASSRDGTLPGNWRLVLLLTDGSTVPLSGLDHGSFKENRLFWAPARDGQPRNASGSMPWPNDQPLEVAALLNATLAEADGHSAQAAETSG